MKVRPEQDPPKNAPLQQNYVMDENHLDESYVIEEALPSGFWHRMDRRVENIAEKFSNTKVGEILKKVIRGAGIVWNSPLMKPISWPLNKLLQGVNQILKHPIAQFGTFVTSLTIAIIALTAATPVGIPLAATAVALIAGSKIVKTFHEARKHYRLAKLQEQINLIKVCKGMIKAQKEILEKFSPKVRTKIEEQLTRKTSEQKIYRKQERAKSQIVAENIASNLLSMAASVFDISQLSSIPNIIHSMKHPTDAINTVLTQEDVKELANMPSEEKTELTEVLMTENEARKLINSLSMSVEIPHVQSTSELRSFVANVVADTLALQEITAAPDVASFLQERQQVLDSSKHHQELPKQQSSIVVGLESVGKGAANMPLSDIKVPQTPRVGRKSSTISK